MIGIGSASPRGINGLGKTWVNGRSRVPLPPASRTAFMSSRVLSRLDGRDHRLTATAKSTSTSRSPHEGRGATWWRPPPRTPGRAASTWWSNVCARPSRAACSAIRRRAASSVIALEGAGQLVEGVGRGDDEPFAAVGHQLARAVARGRDDRQAAGQGLEDDQRAGVVIGRRDEEVAGPVAGADVGDEADQVDRPFQAEPTDHPADRRGLPRAADEQVDRAARRAQSALRRASAVSNGFSPLSQ